MENQDANKNNVQVKGPEANIVFVGREKFVVNGKDGPEDKTRELEPFKHIQNGMDKINMPSADEQKKPFYHKQAGTIIALFPDFYKAVKPKA